MNESGCVNPAVKKGRSFFKRRLTRAENDWRAINDPEFGRVSYIVIDRRYKLPKGRCRDMCRVLGIQPPTKPTQIDKLVSLHNSGKIDLDEMSNTEIKEVLPVWSGSIAKARKILGIKKPPGEWEKKEVDPIEVSNLMSGWGR